MGSVRTFIAHKCVGMVTRDTRGVSKRRRQKMETLQSLDMSLNEFIRGKSKYEQKREEIQG